MPLDRADGAVRVGHRLPLGHLADEHLAGLGEGDHRRGRPGPSALGITVGSPPSRVATTELVVVPGRSLRLGHLITSNLLGQVHDAQDRELSSRCQANGSDGFILSLTCVVTPVRGAAAGSTGTTLAPGPIPASPKDPAASSDRVAVGAGGRVAGARVGLHWVISATLTTRRRGRPRTRSTGDQGVLHPVGLGHVGRVEEDHPGPLRHLPASHQPPGPGGSAATSSRTVLAAPPAGSSR